MSTSEVRTFFESYIATLNRHEFHRLPEFMHDEVVENGAPVTRDEVVAKMTALGEAVPDLTWRLRDVVIDGDRLAARFPNSATHTNE